MAVALTINEQITLPRGILVTFTIVFSGTYPTGGETLDFRAAGVKTSRAAKRVHAAGIAGFVYQYSRASGKILVYCNTAGGANAALGEHTAAGYAAGVSGDTIEGFAIFDKLI